MAQHNIETHFTIDAGGDRHGEVDAMTLHLNQDVIETTNFDSGGRKERLPTLYDMSLNVTLGDPQVDENAAGVQKDLYDGSILGGGDGIYAVVSQKVTSGGTGGTATTTDPTYAFNATVDGFDIIAGGVADAVNKGSTVNFSSTGAITRATS